MAHLIIIMEAYGTITIMVYIIIHSIMMDIGILDHIAHFTLGIGIIITDSVQVIGITVIDSVLVITVSTDLTVDIVVDHMRVV